MKKPSPTLPLANGTAIPRLGFGVWQIPDGQETIEAVNWALEAGYRHIDTAKLYDNETGVGEAVRASKVPRKDIWVTTKLWGTDQLHVAKALEGSLERLGLDYVDLYLVHFPIPGLVTKSWQQMEAVYKDGQAKAIGVSNYSVAQLQRVMKTAKVAPMVNQVRYSPFDVDEELLAFCKVEGIIVEAYSPLTRGRELDNPVISAVAAHYDKTPAQIFLRWALQQDLVVLPKSQHQGRIIENAAIFDFEISPADMEKLRQLA